MALTLGELLVEIGADTLPLEKAGKKVKKTANSMDKAFSRLGKTIAGALTIEAARRIIIIADNMTMLEGRIKRITRTTGDFNKVWSEISKTADETGQSLAQVARTFERMQLSTQAMGKTNDEVLLFNENLQKLARISGATAQEAGAALIQLSQAMATGLIRGEEFNSVMEQLPEVMRTAARNIKGVDGDIGKLRARMLAGKLTSEEFFNSIIKSTKNTNKEFSQLPRTIDMASSALSNNFAKAIKELDRQLGGTENIAKFFDLLAGELGKFAVDVKLKPLKDAQFELAKIDAEVKKINESNASLLSLQKALKESSQGRGRAEISRLIDEHSATQGNIKALEERRSALLKQIKELQKDPDTKPKGKGKGKGKITPTVISVDDEIKRLNLIADVYSNKFAEIEADILSQRQKAIKLYGEDSQEFLQIDEQLNAKRITLRAEAEKEMLEKSNESKQNQLDTEIDALEEVAKANEKLASDAARAQIKAAEQTAAAFEAMSDKIGSELGAALTKTQSFSDSFKNIISNLAGQLISAGITSAFGGAVGGGNIFSGLFSSAVGATAGGNAFGGGVSPIASHRVNERGDPEMLEQAGKQFLLPNGKGGKVTPLSGGKGGGSQPNISMINMGTPMNVESVNITEDGVEIMINDKLAAFDKSLTAEMSKPNSSKSRAFKNTFRLEQNMGR